MSNPTLVKPDRVDWLFFNKVMWGTVFHNGEAVASLRWDFKTRSFKPLPTAEQGYAITLNDDQDRELTMRFDLWADEPHALAAQWLELCAA